MRGPRVPASPVTVQLMPDELSFQRSAPRIVGESGAPPTWESLFKWDGKVGDGYRFEPAKDSAGMQPLEAQHTIRCGKGV